MNARSTLPSSFGDFRAPSPLVKSDVTARLTAWNTVLRRIIDTAWEQALREFFDQHECGMPTEVTLRNHGVFIYPPTSQVKGLGHRQFQWRGQIVLEGWLQQQERGSRYVIHPHQS